MELSLQLVQSIGQLFLMIGMGFCVVKARLIKAEDSKVLSRITLYLIMPCMIINSFQVDFTTEKLLGVILSFIGAFLMHLIYILVSKPIGKLLGMDTVERASIIYGNGGNLIIPLVTSIFGVEYVLYTSGFMIVQTVLLWTHCRMILSGKHEFSLANILKNINIIAIFIGIVLFVSGLRFPAMVTNAIASVGGTVGPVSMIVTGMLLGGATKEKLLGYKRVPVVCLFKLILFPAVILLIYKFTPLHTIASDGMTVLLISFLAAAAPTASSVTQLAQVYGGNSEYASVINMVTTLLCIITLPLMVLLFQL